MVQPCRSECTLYHAKTDAATELPSLNDEWGIQENNCRAKAKLMVMRRKKGFSSHVSCKFYQHLYIVHIFYFFCGTQKRHLDSKVAVFHAYWMRTGGFKVQKEHKDIIKVVHTTHAYVQSLLKKFKCTFTQDFLIIAGVQFVN